MNPDGMVLLLNYREDGVTREFSSLCALESNPPADCCLCFFSFLHFVEGRCQGNQAVISFFFSVHCVHFVHTGHICCCCNAYQDQDGDQVNQAVLLSFERYAKHQTVAQAQEPESTRE